MSGTDDSPGPAPAGGFPLVTVAATLVTLFLFFGLVLVAYNSPSYLGDTRIEPRSDPANKLKEVQARNQAVLDGADPAVKLSVGKATAEVLTHTEKTKDDKNRYGRLPFPIEPPAVPAPTPAEKK
jgi:hypothetical protein